MKHVVLLSIRPPIYLLCLPIPVAMVSANGVGCGLAGGDIGVKQVHCWWLDGGWDVCGVGGWGVDWAIGEDNGELMC